jgi:signal transduction histidine kinase
VRVRVRDTGCGIAPDRIGAIFDDFVTTKRRGLGLGLAISKKIVEQLGGQISVSSDVGKGTTFVLEFPRAKARPIALAAG